MSQNYLLKQYQPSKNNKTVKDLVTFQIRPQISLMHLKHTFLSYVLIKANLCIKFLKVS